MKIDHIYKRFKRDGRCYVIARIKRGTEFSIEQLEVSDREYKTLKQGDV